MDDSRRVNTLSSLAPPFLDWPRIPYVGVGCLVELNGKLLLVCDHRGLWSTPGGHLDFRESPAACAARETAEETGVAVTDVHFVAVTNDVLDDVGKHYVTIWMRGEATQTETAIGDSAEIAEVGWFAPQELPRPLHAFFENLIAGRSMPPSPENLPDSLRFAAELAQDR
ncbi:MAG: NUDIX domain-containing protein [Pseudomonadota bacterium]